MNRQDVINRLVARKLQPTGSASPAKPLCKALCYAPAKAKK
jgi:hypothetical protein